ncbi:MAG: hypothetical protein CI948_2183 [Halanaerobium sp.]|nr:MAG: hypothetical protein CI948_2183 [Halanaerobium sp.]PUU89336.1 MAG: hypothetical protein CI949_2765 [Halanaerobium sp.]
MKLLSTGIKTSGMIFVDLLIAFVERSAMRIISVFLVTAAFLLAFAILCFSQPGLDDYIELQDWERVHFVNRGETLWEIACELSDNDYDIRLVVAAIKEVNGIDSLLKVNQKLILPTD